MWKLFEPIRIGDVWIKNRVAMAPMEITDPILLNRHGSYTQRGIDYYEERARGGTGLIITGCTHIENEVEPTLRYAIEPIVTYDSLPALGELAEAVHYYGSRIFIQLTPGFGRVHYLHAIRSGLQPVSASVNSAFYDRKVMSRALTTREVENLIRSFDAVAEWVAMADIDGVELHGHEGYLFDQFTTALWNQRTDKYGGSLENRLRFPIEALQAIKDRAGKSFPVTYRFGLKHYLKNAQSGSLRREGYPEAGRDVSEGIEMAKALEKAGFDALHVDAGCYESWYWPHPPNYQSHGCMIEMAAEAKKAVRIPVIAVGRLGLPELAETTLQQGKADIIALGRDLLADSHWVKKVQKGNTEDIRPCLGCHDGCMYRQTYSVRPLCCAVNPAVGREKLYALTPAPKARAVLIAGGGVAGMEAARVAAIRGHNVVIYEKSERLGGHLVEASIPEFKQDYRRLLDWYVTQLKKLNVSIELKTDATLELMNKENPDVVIVATGSTCIVPNIPGIEMPQVGTCIELLLGKKKAGDTVAVVGGGLVGCETALWLAQQGKKVTIVEILPQVLWSPAGIPAIMDSNREMLVELLAQNEVNLVTNASIKEITREGIAWIEKDSRIGVLACATVALALGLRPERRLYQSLVTQRTDVYAIGDCNEPRRIMHAIWEAHSLAREI